MPKSFLFVYIFLLPLLVKSQTVDFSFQSTNGVFCTPATIQFTQNCTGNPTGFIWNLGNGLKTFSANPSTSYIIPGSYTVKLIAIFPLGPLEISKTIVITPAVTPNISFDRNYLCQPGIINFSAASNVNTMSYDWDFGDTTGVVSTPVNSISHNFSNYGAYTAILKATDVTGCFGQDTVRINVKKIPMTVTTNPSSGCIPANVSFIAVDTVPLNDAISSYSWDFGDGSPVSSTASSNTSHIYTGIGSFLPKLLITTAQGCSNSSSFKVAFGSPPTIDTAYPVKNSVCGSESPVFVAKAGNANRYSWDFGDGTTALVADTMTTHKYKSVGIKNVSVTPYFNGCAGNTATFSIDVIGVIGFVNYTPDCTDKKTFQFLNYFLGVQTSILWDFGDGSPISNITNPKHTFPSSGQFITKFIVTDANSGCQDTVSNTIYTADPILLNPDISICKNTNTTYAISNNYSNPAAKYTWSVMGRKFNTNTTPTLTVTASILGNSKDTVVINNGSHYCNDTILLNHSILVHGPDLSFSMPTNICFGDFINIQNTSKPFVPGDSITLSYWNYGNSFSNDTVFQPTSLQYNSPGNFRVKLAGFDINGCKDSIFHRVLVSPLPYLLVNPASDTLCSGQSDSLFAYHTDSILWSPSTGLNCATCDTVLAKPTVSTQYFITATNAFNCSIRDSIQVNVIPRFTAVPTANQTVCLNEEVILDVNPKGKIVIWSPASGLSNTQIYNPVASPTQTTTYTAALTDSTGCFTSAANITVIIKTVPSVDAGPDKTLSYNAPFNITPVYSNNVKTYLWTPSTQLNCTTCANPAGIAYNSQTYTIQVTSDSGCVAFDSVNIFLECKSANLLMPKAFTPNNDNLNDYFYPITRGVKTILKFIIYNREGKAMYENGNFPPNSNSLGWNGDFKGKHQAIGGYVYILEALCEQGEKLTRSGSFMLLR